jgi:hypothetical protein
MINRIFILTATLVFLLLPAFSMAATLLVPGDHPTIAAGLAAASSNDTVQIAAGTYFEHDLVMPDGVVLRGETGHHADVIIDAQQAGRVFFCDGLGPGTAVEGLTITGGLSDGEGSHGIGGGVLCQYSSLSFSGCAFMDNYALVGGGISLRYDADVVFEDCLFQENSALSSGGAMRVYQSAPVLRRCRFTDNVVEMDGAGIFSGSSAIHIEDCFFQGNEAGIWGGAILLISPHEGDLVVRGCTLVDNVAIYAGSAVFAANECPFNFENCIVVGNRESEAMYILDEAVFETYACNNVYDNPDGNYGGSFLDQTGLNGNISLPPVFCDPTNGDFSLADISPCLPDNNDCGVLMGVFGLGCSVADGAVPSASAQGLEVFPNPFNPRTTVWFELEKAEPTEIGVYELTGRRVVVLASGIFSAGSHPVTWDGQDTTGRAMPSGIYLVRFQTATQVLSKKIMLVR